jgi:tetratricopeptide (TPR) repeat protein
LLKLSLDFNRGTDKLPEAAQNLNDLGVMSLAMGDTAVARRYLSESLRIYSNVGNASGALSARVNLASADVHEGKGLEGRRALEDIALEAGRKGLTAVAASAYHQIGKSLVRDNELEQARGHFEKAIGLHRTAQSPSGESNGLYQLAALELKLKRFEQAETHVEQAIRLDKAHEYWPALADDLFLLGKILEGMKRNDNALEYYERAFYVYRYSGMTSEADVARAAVQLLGGEVHIPEPAGS